MTLTNKGTASISPWTLTWKFPGDQKITNLWNATYTQSGENITATAPSYATTLAPGASVTVGFTGTYTTSNASPTAFSLNGSACS